VFVLREVLVPAQSTLLVMLLQFLVCCLVAAAHQALLSTTIVLFAGSWHICQVQTLQAHNSLFLLGAPCVSRVGGARDAGHATAALRTLNSFSLGLLVCSIFWTEEVGSKEQQEWLCSSVCLQRCCTCTPLHGARLGYLRLAGAGRHVR